MFGKEGLTHTWASHRNPDGTEGGLVASSAKVGKNVFLDRSAVVTPETVVPDGAVIEAGQIVSPFGSFRFEP